MDIDREVELGGNKSINTKQAKTNFTFSVV